LKTRAAAVAWPGIFPESSYFVRWLLRLVRKAPERVGAMSKKHMGSSIDDLLKEEGIFEEAQARAVKEVVAWQLAEATKKIKAPLAKMLKTSHTQVNRILDPKPHYARQPATRICDGRSPCNDRDGVTG
jgi:antitoxin HicB